MKSLDEFFAEMPDLGKRRPSFQFICERLLEKDGPFFIVETGTTRAPHHFEGDGCSTVIWDKLSAEYRENKSKVVSIDIDIEAIHKAMAATDNVNFICDDSITYLRQLIKERKAEFIDLLYLDSFDFYPGIEMVSATHHLAEITAIYWALRPGCYIMVDDCHSENIGKHMLVREFLKSLGIDPIFTGYQYIWKKPL